MEAEMTVGFLSFNESYVSQVTCHPHHSVEVYSTFTTNRFLTHLSRPSLLRLHPYSKPFQRYGDFSQYHRNLLVL